MLCAEPKEHKHFRPGARPGGSVTGVTEEVFTCQMFMCPCLAPNFCPRVNKILGAQKKVDVPHPLRENTKRDPRKLLEGIWGPKKGP